MPTDFLIEREPLEKRWMITMKKNKTPGIVYVLYALAAVTFVYGKVAVFGNNIVLVDKCSPVAFAE